MAGFQIVAQHRTVLVRSQTLVEDVMELTAITTPSGVTFVRAVKYDAWHAGGSHDALQPIADHIEAIMAHWPVLSGAAIQSVDASGLITNAVEFVLTIPGELGSQSPPHTTTVDVPVQALHDHTDFTSYFAGPLQALQAAAGI